VSIFLLILNIYTWIVIIATLITWFNPDPRHIAVIWLRRLTEPVFEKIRKTIPSTFNGLDLSPVILLLGIMFIETFIKNLVFG